MEIKKRASKNLEEFRFVFFQIGLIVSLGLVIIILNWKQEVRDTLLIPFSPEEEMLLIDLSQEWIPEKEKPRRNQEKKSEQLASKKASKTHQKIIIVDNGFTIDEPWKEEELGSFGSGEKPELPEVIDFRRAEYPPVFPGCEHINNKKERKFCFEKSILKYVSNNASVPNMAREMGISGKVIVRFIIDVEGNVTDVALVRGVDRSLDAEAIRVVKSIPQMTPAKQRGKAVAVTMVIPINFKLL